MEQVTHKTSYGLPITAIDSIRFKFINNTLSFLLLSEILPIAQNGRIFSEHLQKVSLYLTKKESKVQIYTDLMFNHQIPQFCKIHRLPKLSLLLEDSTKFTREVRQEKQTPG